MSSNRSDAGGPRSVLSVSGMSTSSVGRRSTRSNTSGITGPFGFDAPPPPPNSILSNFCSSSSSSFGGCREEPAPPYKSQAELMYEAGAPRGKFDWMLAKKEEDVHKETYRYTMRPKEHHVDRKEEEEP